jgi:Cellulose biosynthesis protein BcsS
MRVRRGSWQVRCVGRAVPRYVLRGATLAGLLMPIGCGPAVADEPKPAPQYSWREMWFGADATKDVWLLYTGVTLAPLSKDIYTDGLRLRMTSGYGQYKVRFSGPGGSQLCGDKNDDAHYCPRGGSGSAARIESKVDISYVDMLAGYHMQLGNLTAKAFAGASIISHRGKDAGAKSSLLGTEIGATGALEFWLNVNDQTWTSLDLSYSTAHDTAAARWRFGWRALPTLSVGPEIRFDRNEQAGTGRIGAFARYEWMGGEISAAAGVATDLCDTYNGSQCRSSFGDAAPYANVNFLTQY